jgi:drug/metabolite transporter (DMT)-like permease
MTTATADGSQGAPTGALRFLPEGALLLTTIFWAATAVILKDTFTHVDPMAYTFIRFLLMMAMGIGILAVQVRRGACDWRVKRSDLPRFLASGLMGFTIYQIFYADGISQTTAFAAAVLVGLAPLFTILIVTLMGERPPMLAWVGVLVGLVGAVIFIAAGRELNAGTTLGNALCIGAALSFAIYQIINRPLSRAYPPTVTTAYTLTLGTIPLALYALPDFLAQDWSAAPTQVWVSMIYMVIFPVYIAYILWNYGIQKRGVALASSFGLLTPVFSGIGAVIFLQETLGAGRIFGAALVLTGLAIPRLRSAPKPAAT